MDFSPHHRWLHSERVGTMWPGLSWLLTTHTWQISKINETITSTQSDREQPPAWKLLHISPASAEPHQISASKASLLACLAGPPSSPGSPLALTPPPSPGPPLAAGAPWLLWFTQKRPDCPGRAPRPSPTYCPVPQVPLCIFKHSFSIFLSPSLFPLLENHFFFFLSTHIGIGFGCAAQWVQSWPRTQLLHCHWPCSLCWTSHPPRGLRSHRSVLCSPFTFSPQLLSPLTASTLSSASESLFLFCFVSIVLPFPHIRESTWCLSDSEWLTSLHTIPFRSAYAVIFEVLCLRVSYQQMSFQSLFSYSHIFKITSTFSHLTKMAWYWALIIHIMYMYVIYINYFYLITHISTVTLSNIYCSIF